MKRAKWYLDRDLAEIVSEDPPTIKLKFIPNGYGNKGDAFSLAQKHNRCVVCGTEENLTKHHIVPSMYRKFFPVKIKSRSAHDVVVICVECHDEYERIAMNLKKEMEMEILGTSNTRCAMNKLGQEARDKNYLVKLCKTLIHQGHVIPEERKDELFEMIANALGRVPSLVEIEELSKVTQATIKDNQDPGRAVVEKVLENDVLEDFIMRWRQHFIDTAQPKFMPDHWDVERKIAKDANIA